jgi:hypothetical protein
MKADGRSTAFALDMLGTVRSPFGLPRTLITCRHHLSFPRLTIGSLTRTRSYTQHPLHSGTDCSR